MGHSIEAPEIAYELPTPWHNEHERVLMYDAVEESHYRAREAGSLPVIRNIMIRSPNPQSSDPRPHITADLFGHDGLTYPVHVYMCDGEWADHHYFPPQRPVMPPELKRPERGHPRQEKWIHPIDRPAMRHDSGYRSPPRMDYKKPRGRGRDVAPAAGGVALGVGAGAGAAALAESGACCGVCDFCDPCDFADLCCIFC